jgi:hypothetical protein
MSRSYDISYSSYGVTKSTDNLHAPCVINLCLLCCHIRALCVVSFRICKFTLCRHLGTDIVELSEVLFISSEYHEFVFFMFN